MTHLTRLTFVLFLSFALVACAGEVPTDAGDGLDAGFDAGMPLLDAGTDAGTDAGPDCVSGCEYVEIALGAVHACGRQANGAVRCWGRNQELQLGDGRRRHEDCARPGSPPEDCSSLPVRVRRDDGVGLPIIDDAEALSVEGFSQGCVLRGGELWCWGEETVLEAAAGSPRQRPAAERDAEEFDDVMSAAVGSGHLCAIHGTGNELHCAGRFNGLGQQGIGSQMTPVLDFLPVLTSTGPDVPLVSVTQVESSFSFTCASTATNLYCWGRNEESQLGDDTVYGDCNSDISIIEDCSPLAGVVGGAGAPIGAVLDFDTGGGHVCAIVPGGQVMCWGDNRGGQTGQAITGSDTALPAPVAGITDATQIAAGGRFTCALRASGAVSCWGFNLNGQLGDGVLSHGATCTIGMDPGDCSSTPVQVGGIDDATAISANGSFACAIRADGSVWCWGNNSQRQCGIEDETDQNVPVMVRGTAG